MSEKLKSQANLGETTGWDELAGVEFSGGVNEAREEPPELSEERVELPSFLERQNERRQLQMKAEWARYQVALVDYKRCDLELDGLPEATDRLIDVEDGIIEQHLNEPDGMECLHEIFGDELMSQTLERVRRSYPEAMFEHFDELMHYFDGGAGEKAAAMGALDAITNAYAGDPLRKWSDPEDVPLMKMGEFWKMVELAENHSLRLPDWLIDDGLEEVLSEPDGRELALEKLDFWQKNEADMGVIAGRFLCAGEVEKLKKNWEKLNAAGLEMKQLRRFMEGPVFTEEVNPAALVQQQEILSELGISAAECVRAAVRGAMKTGKLDGLLKHKDDYAALGVDVVEVIRDGVIGRRCKTYAVRYLLKPLNEWGLGISLDELGELDEISQKGQMREFRGAVVQMESLSEEAKAEREGLLKEIEQRELHKELKKLLPKFTTDEWGRLTTQGKEIAMRQLAEVLVPGFGLVAPYEVTVVPQDELSTAVTRGEQSNLWMQASRPQAESFAKLLTDGGMKLGWVKGGRVAISERYLDNGASVVGTLAHELWHAVQEQQAFLYQQGYYKQEQRIDGIDDVPNLAKYYAANFQEYVSSDRDFDEYYGQLVEQDAREVGGRYAGLVRDLQAKYEKGGRGIKGSLQKVGRYIAGMFR